MKKLIPLLTLAAVFALAGAAQAASYSVESFNTSKHSLWIQNYQEHLHFDPAGTLEVGPTQWTLNGTLESGNDGSIWSLSVVFDHVKTGDEFKAITGSDDSRVKGNSWANQQADWMFARDVSGTLTKVSGPGAGTTFALDRMVNSHDYWAQLGTGLNDKNNLFGLSTWLNVTLLDGQGNPTNTVYRGDINVNVNPVPEPSAALAFAVGSLVVGASTRRRKA